MKKRAVLVISFFAVIFLVGYGARGFVERLNCVEKGGAWNDGLGICGCEEFMGSNIWHYGQCKLSTIRKSYVRRIVVARVESIDVLTIGEEKLRQVADLVILQVVKGVYYDKRLILKLDIGQRSSDLALGSEVVLILGDEDSDGSYEVYPGGFYLIQMRQSTGIKEVEPRPLDIPMFRASDDTMYRSHPSRVPLHDFLFSLGKLNLRLGWQSDFFLLERLS